MFRRVILLPLIFVLSFCGSSDDPEPENEDCYPLGMILGLESIEFSYSAEGKLQAVSYYSKGGDFRKKDTIEYNAQNQITVIERTSSINGVPRTYNFSYNNSGKLIQLTETGPALGEASIITAFTHDSQGRLTMGSSDFNGISSSYRYEYNSDGNVEKVYYTTGFGGEPTEVLGREQLTFDDTEQFYFATPELQLYFVFLLGSIPSANNNLSTTIYYSDPRTSYNPPLEVEYEVEYNSQGLVTKSYDKNFVSNIVFEEIEYQCR